MSTKPKRPTERVSRNEWQIRPNVILSMFIFIRAIATRRKRAQCIAKDS